MLRDRPFKQVDVFSSIPLLGNPVAVILDSEGLDAGTMQAIANWTNLSETTFVGPPTVPGASYAVRIFTPRAELPFAGHPTLGTAHAVLEAELASPRNGKLLQQCGVGLVEVAIEGNGLSFLLPKSRMSGAPDPQALAKALSINTVISGKPQLVDVGPRWVIAELISLDALESLTPDLAALAAYDRLHATTGLTVFAQAEAGGIAVRSFAPADGVPEDPVCGSGNGAVAVYRQKFGQIGEGDVYIASQGRQVGRDGHVVVRIEGERVHVGGACVTCVDGMFRA